MFRIEKKLSSSLARAGIIKTSHGEIKTPAFIPVGTKATVKSVLPENIARLGAQAVLANTFHLNLEPGEDIVEAAGGLHSFMNWKKPLVTDSGGFQVLSLGEGLDSGEGKISQHGNGEFRLSSSRRPHGGKKAIISEEGVSFFSPFDGEERFLSPESSIQIQRKLGADIIFAFDECTLPSASHEYQKEALDRTSRWAKRSLEAHTQQKDVPFRQLLFGVVQGGRQRDLREESARGIGGMDFDGFGIGGSFDKRDMGEAVAWVNALLPEEKPRHLLGIGEPLDIFEGIAQGCDTFDCVLPTRFGRNGTLLTRFGRRNLLNSSFRRDFSAPEEGCSCEVCTHYSKAYLAHLFRSGEMLGATLASIHNLFFLVSLVDSIRESILNGTFEKLREEFEFHYHA